MSSPQGFTSQTISDLAIGAAFLVFALLSAAFFFSSSAAAASASGSASNRSSNSSSSAGAAALGWAFFSSFAPAFLPLPSAPPLPLPWPLLPSAAASGFAASYVGALPFGHAARSSGLNLLTMEYQPQRLGVISGLMSWTPPPAVKSSKAYLSKEDNFWPPSH